MGMKERMEAKIPPVIEWCHENVPDLVERYGIAIVAGVAMTLHEHGEIQIPQLEQRIREGGWN